MASMKTLPDAWDDDYEAQADRNNGAPLEPDEEREAEPASRRERLAKHAEAQRKLWESAYVTHCLARLNICRLFTH
jgi:hypothetical protein